MAVLSVRIDHIEKAAIIHHIIDTYLLVKQVLDLTDLDCLERVPKDLLHSVTKCDRRFTNKATESESECHFFALTAASSGASELLRDQDQPVGDHGALWSRPQ